MANSARGGGNSTKGTKGTKTTFGQKVRNGIRNMVNRVRGQQ